MVGDLQNTSHGQRGWQVPLFMFFHLECTDRRRSGHPSQLDSWDPARPRYPRTQTKKPQFKRSRIEKEQRQRNYRNVLFTQTGECFAYAPLSTQTGA